MLRKLKTVAGTKQNPLNYTTIINIIQYRTQKCFLYTQLNTKSTSQQSNLLSLYSNYKKIILCSFLYYLFPIISYSNPSLTIIQNHHLSTKPQQTQLKSTPLNLRSSLQSSFKAIFHLSLIIILMSSANPNPNS